MFSNVASGNPHPLDITFLMISSALGAQGDKIPSVAALVTELSINTPLSDTRALLYSL